ncbi:MAG: glycosyltransferase, partial [Candidatus Pacebacteria bacterium]|nr:glycosyltransferase [Candidatus Paceibacterota bacterium]
MNITWISKIEWDMPHKTSRLKLSEALIKRRHNVTLYMAKKFGENINNKNCIVGLPTINFPIISGFFYGFIIFFYFPILLSKKKVDIIIIDCTKIWLPFIIPLKILNIPIILDIRTLPIDRNESFFFKVAMYMSRYVVNGITTITPELKNILIDIYGLSNMKIGIWSSGVSVEDFIIDKNEETIFNKKESHKDNYTLIYHGDYSPTRGIENLIKAISKLDLHLKINIKLIIIGIPKYKIKDLITLSENQGVKEQINILPKVDYCKI